MKNWKPKLLLLAFYWSVTLGGFLLIQWLFSEEGITQSNLSFGLIASFAISLTLAWTSDRNKDKKA